MASMGIAILDDEATALENAPTQARVNAAAATTATTGSSQQEPGTDDDSDARRCVVCTSDVALDDVCWIGAKCEPHSHMYHIDRLTLWWLETNRRPCPRCTQQVDHFVIHARPVTGDAVSRRFSALGGSSGALTDQLVLIDQSDGFRSIVRLEPSAPGYGAGAESLFTHFDAFDALVGWVAHLWRDKQGEIADEGMVRIRAMTKWWEKAKNGGREYLLVTWAPRRVVEGDTTGDDDAVMFGWNVAAALRLIHERALNNGEEPSDH